MMRNEQASEGRRIEIIPFIHGKVRADGKISEPDIYWILERWFERHPEIMRKEDVRITRSVTTTNEGLKTDLIRATILDMDDLFGYDPGEDRDLFEYFLSEERP